MKKDPGAEDRTVASFYLGLLFENKRQWKKRERVCGGRPFAAPSLLSPLRDPGTGPDAPGPRDFSAARACYEALHPRQIRERWKRNWGWPTSTWARILRRRRSAITGSRGRRNGGSSPCYRRSRLSAECSRCLARIVPAGGPG